MPCIRSEVANVNIALVLSLQAEVLGVVFRENCKDFSPLEAVHS